MHSNNIDGREFRNENIIKKLRDLKRDCLK
jgi:hypothetical protein